MYLSIEIRIYTAGEIEKLPMILRNKINQTKNKLNRLDFEVGNR